MPAPKIEGRKSQKFSFKHEDKELNYEVQEPTFDQIVAALGQVKPNGRMDVIGAGKVIWELCCISYDKEIEENPRILVSVCIQLYADYADTIDIEIKKK
jgi:hypothetical protein